MKITSVKVSIYSYRVEEVFGNSRQWNRCRNTVLIAVETDEGITGHGEADCAGGPPEVTASIVKRELAPLMIGMDPLCAEQIWMKLYDQTMVHGRRGAIIAGISGIDIAIWDLAGKALGVPVYKLLGGARDKVQPYASGGFYHEDWTVAQYGKEAETGRNNGFTAFKMKIGRYAQEKDLARVKAVRDAIGEECSLMVDANSNYQPKEAVRMARAMEELRVDWFEEPVTVENIRGSALVASMTSIGLAGYETTHTRYGFRDLIDAAAIDIAQPDVARAGGFTECRKIAAYASAHNILCTPHVFGSAMSLVAGLHFVAAIENGYFLECEQNRNPLRTDMFHQDITAMDKNGLVTVPQGPGLGVDIDWKAIEKYKLA
jgi:L-alanine-DL-glutamate epimerase-like enolase superfamily enzyme